MISAQPATDPVAATARGADPGALAARATPAVPADAGPVVRAVALAVIVASWSLPSGALGGLCGLSRLLLLRPVVAWVLR